jgi:prepilin-type N-terminal cleavage/methylation domain-containing protein
VNVFLKNVLLYRYGMVWIYFVIMKIERGFTMIELLIVIAIIGILAVTVMQVMKNDRFKAKNASFRSSVSSIKTVWTACCDGGGDIYTKGALEGSDIYICDNQSIIDAVYPGDNNIGDVVVDTQCNEGHYEVTITPGAKNTGSCTSITYDETGEVSNVGC